MEELGKLHDEYIGRIDLGDVETLDAEGEWYKNYDFKVNRAIKEARRHLAVDVPHVSNKSHVKFQKLSIPKFDCDPKTFLKWKQTFERFTKDRR